MGKKVNRGDEGGRFGEEGGILIIVSRDHGRERVWHQKREMRIIQVKGNSFQKSPIQEYGKRATFASLVSHAPNALATLYLVFISLPHSPSSARLLTTLVFFSFPFLFLQITATKSLFSCIKIANITFLN